MTVTENELYPRIMSLILEEREDPPFRLIKRTVKKGTVLEHYLPDEGRIVRTRFSADVPIVVLEENGCIWMSDTPFEMAGMYNAVRLARGKVLTSGLGIGLFPIWAGLDRRVHRVDIVEREKKVIDLVFPQLTAAPLIGDKLNIIHADIYDFLDSTQRRYDFIYLDIWIDFFGPIQDAEKGAEAALRCLRKEGIVWLWLQELIDRVKGVLPKTPVLKPGSPGIYPPCLVCGKTLRNDYGGLCTDCADVFKVSELFSVQEADK